MRVTLIGMSGIGKSHWARRLRQEAGFVLFDCDEAIADLLDAKLDGAGDAIARLAAWMGFPYQPGYAQREDEYLMLENEVTEKARQALSQSDDVVVDATGSLIYVEPDLLERLLAASIVVHLAAPPAEQERMCREYLAYPRPILWRDHFEQLEHQSDREAVEQSYPRLLNAREKRYRELADVTFQPNELRDPNFGIEPFLDRIRKGAPS